MSTRPVVAGTAAAALGLLTADVLSSGPLSRLDVVVHDRLPALHSGWRAAAYLLVLPGQRWLQAPLALGVAGLLCWRRRSPGPLLRLVGAMSVLALSGALLKVAVGRAAPGTGSASVHAGGVSYPSGHVAGIVVVGGLVVDLLGGSLRSRARRVWLALVVAVACGVVLIGFHWLTDAFAGLALGVLLLTAARAGSTASRLLVARPVRWPTALRRRARRRARRRRRSGTARIP